jgi:imidazolonepropionase-like amidohydrolase
MSDDRIALTNARVFDGVQLSEPRTVVIDGAVIGTDAAGARVIDAAGAALLPGLIDAHLHLHGRETLEQLSRYGVTTGLDMASWPPEFVDSLRGVPGLTDIRSPGLPAIAADGNHAKLPTLPKTAIVNDPAEAQQFVADRVAEGVDYIKVVAEAPGQGGPDQATLDALVTAAHAAGKQVIAHAVTTGAYAMAIAAGADVLTHAPLDGPLDAAAVARMAGRVVVPTLVMMEGVIANGFGPPAGLAHASQSVAALHEAGVPVLAGTDANTEPGTPAHIVHGESLARELELLVAAGLSTAEALRAATVLPAKHFGLADRGAVEPGLRADLVLIEGNPLADIGAVRRMSRIWCAGTEHQPAW